MSNWSRFPFTRTWGGWARRHRALRAARTASYVPIRAPTVPLRLSRRITRLERSKELKYLDTTLAATNITNAAGYFYITGVGQGDTSLQREGLKICIKSLQIKFRLLISAAQGSEDMTRVVVVQDRHNNGTPPTWLEVFESLSVMSLREHENPTRFRILFDKVTDTSLKASATDYYKIFKYYKKFKKPIYCKYVGTGSTEGNQGNHGMWIMTLSTTTSNHPIISGECRIRFTE